LVISKFLHDASDDLGIDVSNHLEASRTRQYKG
jgi:hypothetical protein